MRASGPGKRLSGAPRLRQHARPLQAFSGPVRRCAQRLGRCLVRCVPRCTLRRAGARLAQPLADTSTALALRLYRARADAAARPRLP